MLYLVLFYSRATNRNLIKDSDYLKLSKQYENKYFTGIGDGIYAQEQLAIKLAKSNTSGDLSNKIL